MFKKRRLENYLLLKEGIAEEKLFAYLTKVRFRELFHKSNIQFSNKVSIPTLDISNGRLQGVSNLAHFKKKYKLIKERYKGQKRFFFIDEDLDDSKAIEEIITKGNDIIQFIKYNSEYLLLNFAGSNTKKPSDFNNLPEFRKYCKKEFKKEFKKQVSEFKDQDFDNILKDVTDDKIKKAFPSLFSTLIK